MYKIISNPKYAGNDSVMRDAMAGNHKATIKYLLATGYNINKAFDIACEKCNSEIAIDIYNGANKIEYDFSKKFYSYCKTNNSDVVTFLIYCFGDKFINRDYSNGLHVACENSNINVVTSILKNTEVIKYLYDDIRPRNGLMINMMYKTCQNNRIDILDVLLNHGFMIDIEYNGLVRKYYSNLFGEIGFSISIVKQLIDRGADITKDGNAMIIKIFNYDAVYVYGGDTCQMSMDMISLNSYEYYDDIIKCTTVGLIKIILPYIKLKNKTCVGNVLLLNEYVDDDDILWVLNNLHASPSMITHKYFDSERLIRSLYDYGYDYTLFNPNNKLGKTLRTRYISNIKKSNTILYRDLWFDILRYF